MDVKYAFNLLNEETVKVLMQSNPNLLPIYHVNDAKDLMWNQQHLASAIMDGILNGSGTKSIARDVERAMGNVFDSNRAIATRATRTAVTSAQNQGRMDAYSKALSMGINGKIMWLSTLDMRTRDTHALLDGEMVDVGSKFSNGLRFPGDPSGNPSEVYNCRCTTTFEPDGVDTTDAARNYTFQDGTSRIQGMTYDEWKKQHAYELFSKNVASYSDTVLASYSAKMHEVLVASAKQQGATVEQMAEVLDRYIHGQYGTIRDITQEKYGGVSLWESKNAGSSLSAVERATEEELREAELLYKLVAGQKGKPRTLVRTEVNSGGINYGKYGIGTGRSTRYGKAPELGQELSFGVKSSSMDKRFAEKIARNEIAGMGSYEYTLAQDGSEVLAYRIKDATRYLDISDLSDFTTQREALFAGRYKVVGVERTSVATDHIAESRPVKLTIREYAARNGYALEFFTSKKGNKMVRAGNQTYPISALDTPTIATGEYETVMARVNITYVDIVEI